MIGTIVMVFVLLFLTISLVVSVRFVLKRVRDTVVSTREVERSNPTTRVPSRDPRPFDETDERSDGEEETSPVTGRELKARYLRGEMSKEDFERRLRALQLDDYLRGRE